MSLSSYTDEYDFNESSTTTRQKITDLRNKSGNCQQQTTNSDNIIRMFVMYVFSCPTNTIPPIFQIKLVTWKKMTHSLDAIVALWDKERIGSFHIPIVLTCTRDLLANLQ